MSDREHARLSASGAERWINCSPSLLLEEQFEDKESEYMAEGTLAHAIAELKLRKYIAPMSKSAFTRAMNKLKGDKLYKEEMQRHTDDYLDHIKTIMNAQSEMPHCAVELQVDYSEYAPEGFGTADCVLLHGNDLWIIDFKYGQGKEVFAENNPQMMLYALGAIHEYGMIYAIENVHMTIFQPRIDNVSTWSATAAELIQWGETVVKPAAAAALAGTGQQRVGAHCRFCKARGVCRAQADENLKLAQYEFKKSELLEPHEIGDVLTRARALVTWAEAVEEYARGAILAGAEIPGWKVVEGKSRRAFTDAEAAFKVLEKAGYKDDTLYEFKARTLAGLEKIIGKAKFNEILEKYITWPPGSPTLAVESDERKPYGLAMAQREFGEAI